MAFTKVADFALFGMEDLQTPTDAIPLPIDDMASLRSGVTYIFKGLPIYVEYVKGEERTGKAPDGKEWSQICPTAYGYIPKTKDADGEDIDVYLNQIDFDPAAMAYVMDQNIPETGAFDEHKSFIGYPSEDRVLGDYCAMVPDGERRVGGLASMPLPDFIQWASSPLTLKPIVGAQIPSVIAKVISKKPVVIPKTDKAPKILVRKTDKGVAIEIYILSEFDLNAWGPALDTMIDFIESAGSDDTIVIGISSYGGMLDVGTRIASAIRITKAKVTTISLGPVASAGCLVWCEGHERLISSGSYFMQHEASCVLEGRTSQIAKMALVTSEYVKSIIFPKAIAAGLFTEEEIEDMVDKGRDIFISAREAAQRTGAKLI